MAMDKKPLSAPELWHRFCVETGLAETTPYEAWAFGEVPDKLADLVLRGIKTATASAYDAYQPGEEPVPKVGDYSVILNAADEALCVIRDTKVEIVPFRDVSAEHAFNEGEGDRSLAYWRAVHEEFFTGELSEVGLSFDENRLVVCETFEVLYRA